MYAPVYFAPRFYPRSYFPSGAQVVEPRYFHHGYFAGRYFPDRYFPGDEPVVSTVKPRYFLHSYFVASFYADRYFPGDVVSIAPSTPPPPSVFGGAAHPSGRFAPAIHGHADLRLPVIRLHAVGHVTQVEAVLDAELARIQFRATGQTTQPEIKAGKIEIGLPVFSLSAEGTATSPTRRSTKGRSRVEDEAEEQLVLEHYMLSLKGDG